MQRRLAHLLTSLTELQDHVGNATSLDEWSVHSSWPELSNIICRPSLLSRHLALISQTHSLTVLISQTHTNRLQAQEARFSDALLEDAKQRNKFSEFDESKTDEASASLGKSGDALFGGKSDMPNLSEDPTAFRFPAIQYSDGPSNPLRRIAPHPFYPLDSEKSHTSIPSLLLPRVMENDMEMTQSRWEAWLKSNVGIADDTQAQGAYEEERRRWIDMVTMQTNGFDDFADQAIRSWVHAREATDEMGQQYDWKMRLDLAEDSDSEEEGEMPDSLHEGTESSDKKRKRGLEMETTGGLSEHRLSLKQVIQFIQRGSVEQGS